jgi:hypothetical protein
LLRLFINPEDEGGMFLRNVGRLLPGYKALSFRREKNASKFVMFVHIICS